MRHPFHWPRRDTPGTSSLIVVVLIGSMVVAAVLATQAIVAARERRAISEAMLRQYAELAAWEFSRQARRDIEQSLAHTLGTYAHPQRSHEGGENCNCDALTVVEWFEVTAAGAVKTASDSVRTSLGDATGGAPQREASAADGLRTIAVNGDRTRFIAMKPEPHLGDGGLVGLVASTQSLQPLLAKSYARAALLPGALTGSRDPRTLVDLRIVDAAGTTVFASRDTTPGPYVVESVLLAGLEIPLVAQVSVTPAFIAGLGPAHGAAPRTTLVVTLVAVNALLVMVGLWQLARERELARLRSNFVAGVSHELRTPLAQIRMFSETLLLDRDPECDRETAGARDHRAGMHSAHAARGQRPALSPTDANAFQRRRRRDRSERLRARRRRVVRAAGDSQARRVGTGRRASDRRRARRPRRAATGAAQPARQRREIRARRPGHHGAGGSRSRAGGADRRRRRTGSARCGSSTHLQGVRARPRDEGDGRRRHRPRGGETNRRRPSGRRLSRGRAGGRRSVPRRSAADRRRQRSGGGGGQVNAGASVANILLIEDNRDLAYGLRNNLEIDGHAVVTVETGEDALAQVRDGVPDLIVLDLMLPNLDGYQVLRRLRADGHDMPVLILTARTEEADKVLGFRLGADDYVTKPFGVLELLARVSALIRRSSRSGSLKTIEKIGDIEINRDTRVVTRAGAIVELTPMEFDLLMALIARRGATASRLDLLRDVWGHSAAVVTRTVDTHVAELRRKLEEIRRIPGIF